MYNIIQLNNKYNLGIAPMVIPKEAKIKENLIAKEDIPYGHKVALEKIIKNEFILRYGQIIGIATKDIMPGEHVHSHNLEFAEFERKYK